MESIGIVLEWVQTTKMGIHLLRAGLATDNDINLQGARLNADGQITTDDLVLLHKMLAGLS